MFFQDCTTVHDIATTAGLDWDTLTPVQADRFQVLAQSLLDDRKDLEDLRSGAYAESSSVDYLEGCVHSATNGLRLMADVILNSPI